MDMIMLELLPTGKIHRQIVRLLVPINLQTVEYKLKLELKDGNIFLVGESCLNSIVVACR